MSQHIACVEMVVTFDAIPNMSTSLPTTDYERSYAVPDRRACRQTMKSRPEMTESDRAQSGDSP